MRNIVHQTKPGKYGYPGKHIIRSTQFRLFVLFVVEPATRTMLCPSDGVRLAVRNRIVVQVLVAIGFAKRYLLHVAVARAFANRPPAPRQSLQNVYVSGQNVYISGHAPPTVTCRAGHLGNVPPTDCCWRCAISVTERTSNPPMSRIA